MSQVHEQPILRSVQWPTFLAGDAVPSVLSGVPWRQRYQMSLRLTDAAIIAAAVLMSTNWAPVPSSFTQGTGESALVAVLLGLTWMFMMFMFRTRDPRLIGVGALEYKRVVHASAATFGCLAVVTELIAHQQDLKVFLLLTFPGGVLALLLSRWVWRRWLTHQRQHGHFLSKVLVVGKHKDVQYVIRQIRKNTGAVYDVVGAVLEGNNKSNVPAPDLLMGDKRVPTVRGLKKIEDTVGATGADAVIIAGHLHKGGSFIRELGWRLERTSTELVLASSLTNVAGPRIQMRPVEGLPLVHVEMPQFTGGRHVVKRAMDIIVALTALVVLSPLFLVLAVLIRHDSPGPAFFTQWRMGRRAALFPMFKFRSMVTTAEAELERLRALDEGNGVLFKLRHDPRVTRVGRWIRKYSLDELPQLYNVLKGDMSLVGPRPPLPEEVSGYVGHTHRRLFIKPGLTGLWQINGRSNLDWDESVRLDLYYVENWSVTGDLMIMWRTLKVLLKPVGAY